MKVWCRFLPTLNGRSLEIREKKKKKKTSHFFHRKMKKKENQKEPLSFLAIKKIQKELSGNKSINFHWSFFHLPFFLFFLNFISFFFSSKSFVRDSTKIHREKKKKRKKKNSTNLRSAQPAQRAWPCRRVLPWRETCWFSKGFFLLKKGFLKKGRGEGANVTKKKKNEKN